ncbi:DUF3617 domain-containing protein [Phreatobacter stygius]|uniref:DUF3617 family protein n=1 Tax=Phreatobacter stygius TaxID=1940610 RepID=A0A4D7ATE2_9HYPH|nr:DUF3617 family protein [Phreatobacter stygius]QCI62835.1 DUF3617 family protein [Phreatobacter stygius]
MRAIPLLALPFVVASISPALAQATVEFPARRTGQWEIRMGAAQVPGMPEMVVKTCVDPASDRQMMQAGMNMLAQNCEKRDMRRDASGIVIDSICQMGPMRITSSTVISGDFQASYSVRSSATVQTPNQPNPQTTTTVQEARWAGATCTDGMVPGDILMPGGQKMNIRSLPGMAPGQQQPATPTR